MDKPGMLLMKKPVPRQFLVRPLYMQVYDTLLVRIQSGEWPPGKSIPNEIELSQELGVSVGTTRKALEEMVRSHMVERRQGRGTFVCDQTSLEMRLRFTRLHDSDDQPVKGLIKNLEYAIGPAEPDEERRLELRAGAQVIRLRRLRAFGEKALMDERVCLPLDVFPHATEDARTKTVGELAQANGIMLNAAVEKVGVALASADTADHLGVEPGAPLLELDRVISTVEGRPVEWRVARCNLGDVRYVVRMN